MRSLYIPDADEERVKKDFRMWEIIDLFIKHKRILELTAAGDTTKEIGKKIFKSARTVEVHIYEMTKAIGAKNKPALIAASFRLKVIQ